MPATGLPGTGDMGLWRIGRPSAGSGHAPSLDRFCRPASGAVAGASSDPKKLGHAVLDNLVRGGYLGNGRLVYPINPKGGTILGQAAYPSVQDVPGAIDPAVIVIAYMLVPEALRAGGLKKTPA